MIDKNINFRVKELRKHLNLTQKEFGEKITVAQTYLSQIEKGDRDVTEKIFKIICLVFNVNEEWLRNGEGKMFIEINEEEQVSRLFADVMQGRLPSTQRLLKKIALLDDSEREEFEKLLDKLMSE